jgi:hypothetical protein
MTLLFPGRGIIAFNEGKADLHAMIKVKAKLKMKQVNLVKIN